MIRGIHHTSISTQDFERLVAFYRDVVGLELVASYGWDRTSPDAENLDKIVGLKGSSTESALFRTGNTHLEIFRYVTPVGKQPIPDRPACDAGLTHVAFDVIDILPNTTGSGRREFRFTRSLRPLASSARPTAVTLMETSSSFRRSWTRAIRSRWRTFFRTLENRHAKRACVGFGVHFNVQWGAKRRFAQTSARTSEPGSEPASTTAHEGPLMRSESKASIGKEQR